MALSTSRPPIPWPTATAVRAEAVQRGDHVLGVGLDVERGRVRRLRPEVVAQVEGVALPAAAGEVVEVALPDPRPAQLAVDEQDRLAPRAALGQPRLHVQAALGELDLVLADGTARRVAVRATMRSVAVRSVIGSARAYHSCGLSTSPVRALG